MGLWVRAVCGSIEKLCVLADCPLATLNTSVVRHQPRSGVRGPPPQAHRAGSVTLLSSRVWHLSIRKWTSNCFSHQERSVAIPLVARETEEKGSSPLGPLHLTNTTQIWKVALSRGSGYTVGFEVACQGFGGSAGPKSGPDCLMGSWLRVDNGGGARSGQRTLLRAGMQGALPLFGSRLCLECSMRQESWKGPLWAVPSAWGYGISSGRYCF